MIRLNNRNNRGTAMAEFGPVVVVLFCFFFLPLINLSFVPVRFMLCQGAVADLTRRLAHCEKRSDADAMLKRDRWWHQFASACGATITNERLAMIITTADGADRLVVQPGGKIGAEWLPGGAKSPCIYSMEVKAQASIDQPYKGIPGLGDSVTTTLCVRTQWENLSRDPKSQNLDFFINE